MDGDEDDEDEVIATPVVIPAGAPRDGTLAATLSIEYVPEALGTVVAIMRLGGRNSQTRLAAAKLVLELSGAVITPNHDENKPAPRLMDREAARTELARRFLARMNQSGGQQGGNA